MHGRFVVGDCSTAMRAILVADDCSAGTETMVVAGACSQSIRSRDICDSW